MARPKKTKGEEPVTTIAEDVKIKAPKAIGPYDIIKLMFTDLDGFSKLSNLALERNAFMINRIFAIQFPQQAHCFNNTKINTAQVVKMWQLFAVKTLGFGKLPSFVYTKGSKKTTQTKEKNNSISTELRNAYCKHYDISLNDYKDLEEFYYDELIKNVKTYEKITSVSEQNKLITKG